MLFFVLWLPVIVVGGRFQNFLSHCSEQCCIMLTSRHFDSDVILKIWIFIKCMQQSILSFLTPMFNFTLHLCINSCRWLIQSKKKMIPSMFLWFQEFKQMTLELLVPFSTRTYDVMVMMTGFFYILSVSLKVLALIWNFYHFFKSLSSQQSKPPLACDFCP